MKFNWIRLTALSLLLPAVSWGALTTPSTIFRQGNGGLPDSPETNDRFGFALQPGDFNGDGFEDLAIGVIGESGSGAVQVIYGTSQGLAVFGVENPPNPLTSDYFTQSTLSIIGGDQLSETGDNFGQALCAGDINGDGFDELVIGAPGEKVGTAVGAGMISVVYGSALGLDLTDRAFFTQETSGVEGTTESNDAFGSACVIGNFNGDDYGDLAVGIQGEDTQAGAVQIFYGAASGVSVNGDKILVQGETPGAPAGNYTIGLFGTSGNGAHSAARDGERFGYSLAVGNFDGDAYDDLAIGVPFDEFSQGISWIIAGGFHIAFGSSSGITANNNLYYTEATQYIPGVWEGGDQLGASLAVGDFDSDGYDDLLVGMPGEPAVTGGSSAGTTIVVLGDSNRAVIGGSVSNVQQINQGGIDSVDPEDNQEANDKFGQTVAAGRYPESSNQADFVIVAATGETVSSITKAGAISVVYPGAGGLLVPEEKQFFTQNTPNFGDACEANDQLGLKLASGDFNGDGSPDLAIGVPEEDFTAAITNSGLVQILYFPAPEGELVFEDGFITGDTSNWSPEPPSFQHR